MPKQLKYDKILDALQKLLETKELSNISVSEIAPLSCSFLPS